MLLRNVLCRFLQPSADLTTKNTKVNHKDRKEGLQTFMFFNMVIHNSYFLILIFSFFYFVQTFVNFVVKLWRSHFKLNSFLPVSLEIFQHISSQPIQCTVICFPGIRFRKLVNETSQVCIFSNHKRCNRYFQLSAGRGQVEAAVYNLPVKAKAVLIIFSTFFYTGWLAICNHKDLLIVIFSFPENIHGQFQPGNRIGMIRAHL